MKRTGLGCTMNKNIIMAVAALLLLPSFIITSVSGGGPIVVTSGDTIYVGGAGPGNYSSIQSAIDNASDGDTVFVYNGTYYEHALVIHHSIELIGENKFTTIIDGEQFDYVIFLNADNVKLKGFKITNGSKSGIVTYNCSNIEISDNIIMPNSIYGIYCVYSGNITIRHNFIAGNGAGLVLWQLNGDNVVELNTILLNSAEVLINGVNYSSFIVKDNNFILNGRKQLLVIDYSKKIQIDGNYWNRPRILPKMIPSSYGRFGIRLIFDWHPAKKPHHILLT